MPGLPPGMTQDELTSLLAGQGQLPTDTAGPPQVTGVLQQPPAPPTWSPVPIAKRFANNAAAVAPEVAYSPAPPGTVQPQLQQGPFDKKPPAVQPVYPTKKPFDFMAENGGVSTAAPAKPAQPGTPGYAEYLKAKQAELAALDALSDAGTRKDQDAAVDAFQKSKELQQQTEDTRIQAASHDMEVQHQIQNMQRMSAELAAKKIDPDRYYKNMSTAASLNYTLAAALGGLAQGWNHGQGPNYAVDIMKNHVDNDIAAQRSDLENGRQRIADAQGILGETYRRFGNMDQAESAAKILSLQNLDAQAAARAAGANSQATMAKYGLLKAQLGSEIAKEKYNFAAKSAAAAAGGKDLQLKRLKEQAEIDALNAKTDALKNKDRPVQLPEPPPVTDRDVPFSLNNSSQGRKIDAQERYKAEVTAAIKAQTGLRGKALTDAAEPFATQPRDDAPTAAARRADLEEFLRTHKNPEPTTPPGFESSPEEE